MSDHSNAIEIDHLTKRFGSLVAVNNVSLGIKKGEIFGLLGPNGAGKSTIINILLSLLDPTSGKAYIQGIDMAKEPNKAKLHIGLVAQETVVESELTGEQNLQLFGRLYQMSEDDIKKRIEAMLDLSELQGFRKAYAGTYSGGMQRRLAISKALMHSPSILILDEPTTGLDIQNRTKIWDLLREINEKQQVTILMTTQYLEEADFLCNRIGIIDHGKIMGLGTPSQLKQSIGEGELIEVSAEKENLKAIIATIKEATGKDARVAGEHVTVTVQSNAPKHLEKILDMLNKRKVTFSSVSIHAPTLDDVFLKLTGGSLRDTQQQETSALTKMKLGMGK